MAKRFTDTDKWERPWFRNLKTEYKLLWCYVLDKCDIAGVWYVDLELASFLIGFKYVRLESEENLKKQIEIKGDRWLVKDFIPFQYGNLTKENKLYFNVQRKLKEFKDGAFMPHISPIYGVKDKDKDKDKEKDKESLKTLATEIPRQLTNIQKVIKGWKFLMGVPLEGDESKAWDRAHFSRCAASAEKLIDLFGYPEAVHAMEFVFNDLKSSGLNFTFETVVKHSDKYREVTNRATGNSQGNASLPVIRDAIKAITSNGK